MDWLNLHVSVLDSEEFLGEPPEHQGTWIKLQRYCIGQENGGIIRGLGRWKNRKLEQILRVTEQEIRADSSLWTWHGDDLHVWAYPAEKEEIVRAKRQIARENGKLGGRPQKGKPKSKPKRKPILEPKLVPTSEPISKPISESGREVEGKGKGSGKEVEATPQQQARALCLAHPHHPETRPALHAALRAISRHPFETILAGTQAYAAQVAGWTEAERLQFVQNAERFFEEDTWNQSPENWRSRHAARVATNGRHLPKLDTGGRKPAAIRDITVTVPSEDDEPSLDF